MLVPNHQVSFRPRLAFLLAVLLVAVAAGPAFAQAAQAPPAQQPAAAAAPRQSPRAQVPMDPDRARQLYVSKDPAHQSIGTNFQRAIDERVATEARYPELCKGIIDYQKVSYRSSVGDLDIPAYLFQPIDKKGPKEHAAMVWVHGGVHGNWGITMFPFVKEAVERGYVVIAPDYRGSIGYGEAYHKEIDYGGYEVDDTMSAAGYLATLPHVDPARIGIMGWSHGGYITLLSIFREKHPFAAGAAIVPVTNLLFRLSLKGPSYQWDFATQKRIQGLPFEKPEIYIARSPLYHVDKLQVPVLVHVSTNDTDVNYVEDQQIVDALRSRKPDLAETKTYVDPAPWGASVGHAFSRRVDPKTLQRVDSPDQIDSWNRTWTFFEWNLRKRLRLRPDDVDPAHAVDGDGPGQGVLRHRGRDTGHRDVRPVDGPSRVVAAGRAVGAELDAADAAHGHAVGQPVQRAVVIGPRQRVGVRRRIRERRGIAARELIVAGIGQPGFAQHLDAPELPGHRAVEQHPDRTVGRDRFHPRGLQFPLHLPRGDAEPVGLDGPAQLRHRDRRHDREDGHDHQQLDQRESRPRTTALFGHVRHRRGRQERIRTPTCPNPLL